MAVNPPSLGGVTRTGPNPCRTRAARANPCRASRFNELQMDHFQISHKPVPGPPRVLPSAPAYPNPCLTTLEPVPASSSETAFHSQKTLPRAKSLNLVNVPMPRLESIAE